MIRRLAVVACIAAAACGGTSSELTAAASRRTSGAPAGSPPGASSAGSSGAGPASPGPQQPPPASAATLLAGAAAVDVTPDLSLKVPLAGFGGSPRRVLDWKTIPLHLNAVARDCWNPDPSRASTLFAPAKGVLDPIMARAVVLANGKTKVAIVKLDAIAVTREVRDALAAVAASLGIPPEGLIVAATHTHSGPGAMSTLKLWQVLASDCFHQGNFDALAAGAERALREADAALRPAAIGVGSTQVTNASRNRAGRPAIRDTELGVIKVTDAASGAPIAAVLNFAVHGTAHGQSNLMFSADVMGVAERAIEAGLGGGVAVFTNGAEGDVSPSGGLAAGDAIAAGYLAAWPSIATRTTAELQAAFHDVPLPRPVFNVGCPEVPLTGETACEIIPGFSLQIPLDRGWLARVAPFQAVRIDDTVLATVPGEPITEIGWDIKARAAAKGFAHAFVVGLANEHISYVTTRAEYARGEYEGTATLYGPGTGELVVLAADAAMEAVRP